jgi:hypothetical protein
MKLKFAGGVLATLSVAAVSLAGVLASSETAAQAPVTMGVDTDPTGNTATSLGPIDSCVSVSTGDTFEVDLFITDVADLVAWEAYFEYDMTVVNVVKRNVMMFEAAEPKSRVFDLSEALPDIEGHYRMTVADIAEPPAPESGSGTLGRLTLKAVGPGVSPANILVIDIDSDGKRDGGPFLTSAAGEPIGDVDGNGVFDGPISNAQIAVDTACPATTASPAPTEPVASPSPTAPVASPSPTSPVASPSPTPSAPASPEATATPIRTPTVTPPPASPTAPAAEDGASASGGGPPWLVVGAAGGAAALAALAAGGAALVYARRRSLR